MRASRLFPAVLLSLLLASAAKADTVIPEGYTATIRFTDTLFAWPSQSIDFCNPDTPLIHATATATAGDDPASVLPCFLGLSVASSQGDPFQIDGFGSRDHQETLWLEFNTHVVLKELTLGRARAEDFVLLSDEGGTMHEAYRGSVRGTDCFDLGSGTITFNTPIAGTRFGFTVADHCDAYSLQSVTVAAAPLPSSAWMGLLLLSALAVHQTARHLRS